MGEIKGVELDAYITGNYGEDQFAGICEGCEETMDNHECRDCLIVLKIELLEHIGQLTDELEKAVNECRDLKLYRPL